MADTKIINLPTDIVALADGDKFAVADASATAADTYATALEIKNYCVPKPMVEIHLTADETGKTDATLTDTALLFSVTSGRYYMFMFFIGYQSTVATVGLKLGMTTPTFTIFTALSETAGQAADKAGAVWQGTLNSSGDATVATATLTINTDEIAIIRGFILPSANGTLRVQYAAETTGATVTMKRGSCGVMWDLT
jgi:hypothetical protein